LQLSACPTVIDIIGNLLTYVRQFEKFFFHKDVFCRIGHLALFGRLLAQIIRGEPRKIITARQMTRNGARAFVEEQLGIEIE
jgi:hypothetical protein